MFFHPTAARTRARLILILAVAFITASLRGAEREIMVNVDLTPAGNKVAAPTPEKPAHYLMVLGGFKAIGDPVAGETHPSDGDVEKAVKSALAARGYVSINTQSAAPPELLLVVNWGDANPESISGDETFDQTQMRALVGGRVLSNMLLQEAGRAELVSKATYDERYFLTVAAYDYKAASATPSKKVLLWIARMSTPTSRTTLSDVLPALAQSAAPFFGRGTKLPKEIFVDLPDHHARVDIGPTTVMPDAPATPSSSPSP
jgi:hypothetical protein